MGEKNNYYLLDEIGFVGTQKKRKKVEIRKDSILMAKAIKDAKNKDVKTTGEKKLKH